MGKGKKKKLTPEQIEFNACELEFAPIFALFDSDNDGVISLREFEYFAAAIGYPIDGILRPRSTAPPSILGATGASAAEPAIPDFMKTLPDRLTQAMAIELITDLKRLTTYSDKLKYELQALLALQNDFPHPILERKQLFALLSAGGRPMTAEEFKWLTDAIKKEIATVEIEKNWRVDGVAEETIKERIADIEKRKQAFLDLREVIKMCYEATRDGKALSIELRTIHEKEREKKKKEAEARAK